MDANETRSRRIKTCDTVFGIIDMIMEQNGVTIPELAEQTGLAKSTVHDHLKTLEDRGLIINDGREFDLSLKFLEYGNYSIENYDIISAAKPKLRRVADITEETVWLTVEERGQYVNIDMVVGDRGIQTQGVLGGRYTLHAGAAGKTFLAHFPEDRIEEVLAGDLVAHTEKTITSEDELRKEIEEIREEGIAFSDGEVTEGVRGVAAPILTEELTAAILVSGPKYRLQGSLYNEETPQLLREVTNSLELELKYNN